jgi:toxin ParE1/3/4
VARELVYRPAAERDLDAIDDWITARAGPHTARSYVTRLQATCRGLTDFSDRGTPHDDLQPGLRSVPFERRATIYYLVEADVVRIVRILRAGLDPKQEFGPRAE